MKTKKQKILVLVFLALALLGWALGQVRVVIHERNFTLFEGETVSGLLFLLSQNAELQKGSTVDGSVVMLCCNLTVNGNVDGDVFLLTGNLRVNPYAVITGDVKVKTGNLSR